MLSVGDTAQCSPKKENQTLKQTFSYDSNIYSYSGYSKVKLIFH